MECRRDIMKIFGEKVLWSCVKGSIRWRYRILDDIFFFPVGGKIPLMCFPILLLLLGIFYSPIYLILFLIIEILLIIRIKYRTKKKRKLRENEKRYFITKSRIILKSYTPITEIPHTEGVRIYKNKYKIVDIKYLKKFSVCTEKDYYIIKFYILNSDDNPVIIFRKLNNKQKSKAINVLIDVLYSLPKITQIIIF